MRVKPVRLLIHDVKCDDFRKHPNLSEDGFVRIAENDDDHTNDSKLYARSRHTYSEQDITKEKSFLVFCDPDEFPLHVSSARVELVPVTVERREGIVALTFQLGICS